MGKAIVPAVGVRDELGTQEKPWAKIVAEVIRTSDGRLYLAAPINASVIEEGLLDPDRIGEINPGTILAGTAVSIADVATAAAAGGGDPVDRINAGTGGLDGQKIEDDSIDPEALKAASKLLHALLVGDGGGIESDDYNGSSDGFKISKTELKMFLATAIFGGILKGTIEIGNYKVSDTGKSSIVDPGVANSGWHVDEIGRMWLGADTYAAAPFQVDQYGNFYLNDTPLSLSRVDLGAIDATSMKAVQPSQAGGQFSGNLTLTALTRGAQIYYTSNGSDPSDVTNAGRTLYTTPFLVDTSGGNKTIKAVAVKLGMYGAVSTWLFTNSSSATAAPIFSPIPGFYTTPNATFPVILSSGTSGATIIYTDDGSTPSDSNGAVYSGAINIPRDAITTIKAFAKKAGLTPSSVITGIYNITKGSGGGGGGGNTGGGGLPP